MKLLNKALVTTIPLFPKKFIRLFANKYIAGDSLGDAITTVRKLNEKNLMATLDVLGESITAQDEAERSKQENLTVLDAIVDNDLDSNLSIKLTMLGLNIDYELCLENTREIVSYAKSKNIFVRIDMEDSTVTGKTINIFKTLHKEFDNTGIVIQAYLKRSYEDVLHLSEMKANFRICKGIYTEPEEIAYKDKDEIRENFLKLLRLAFEKGSYVGIATHDEQVVYGAYKLIDEFKLQKDRYEFQMLLGVRENLRDEIVAKGHRMRIYIPFGERWYEYSIRRFKENPDVAGHVLKSILTRN
jgi:proline dehydrogenase